MTNPDALTRVERACADLTKAGQPVTFTAVADATGLSRATLYRNPTLRAIITEHRTHAAQAGTLGGLGSEIAHLRTALEAIADKVRRQEERLRRLERRGTDKPNG
jgi:hypothetical protein